MITVALALKYLAKGWSVVPVHTITQTGRCTCGNERCTSPGKHPRIDWKEYTRRLPTRKEISGWFEDEFYGSNIGMVTGSVSDTLVVDLDVRCGAEILRAKLKLPRRTLTARTGGRGTHLFYRMDGYEVQSRIRAFPSVDIKAENAFVVLPPSKHKSGNIYRWISLFAPASIDLSTLMPKQTERTYSDADWYVDLLEGVEEGIRHNTAVRLVGRYLALGLSIRETEMLMATWNESNAPPLSDYELGTIIKYLYDNYTIGKKEVAEAARKLREENHDGKCVDTEGSR